MQFSKLSKFAFTPTRKHSTDAGLDLYACLNWEGRDEETHMPVVHIEPHGFAIIPTKISVFLPEGCAGFIWPKSKNDHLIGGGVVDQGYTGEIFVKVINRSDVVQEIRHGDAIGQLVIQKVETPILEELPVINITTERGATGGIVAQYKSETFSSAVTEVE